MVTGAAVLIHAWRHPRPMGAEGRCIGRTDLPVDSRKAKRLARRIQQHARRHGLPRRVTTSPLRRCADVGRWLRRWGWAHRVDPALLELDFGRWEGMRWPEIDPTEVDRWAADFANCRPGGGESVADLLVRVRAFECGDVGCVVGHAGWMRARKWLDLAGSAIPAPTNWPTAPRYGERWQVPGNSGLVGAQREPSTGFA